MTLHPARRALSALLGLALPIYPRQAPMAGLVEEGSVTVAGDTA